MSHLFCFLLNYDIPVHLGQLKMYFRCQSTGKESSVNPTYSPDYNSTRHRYQLSYQVKLGPLTGQGEP